jgi:hypothetical protein
MATVGENAWYYLDPKSRERKGPIPTSVIKRLLEKGLLGLDATTQVWQPGFEQWKSVLEIPELHEVVEFQSQQWYYIDSNQQQQGPIFSRLLVHKLKEGELDGLSLVYGGKYPEWKKISEILELREIMQKIAEEEEALEQARANDDHQQQQQDAELLAQQTYVPLEDDIIQPAYDKNAMAKGKINSNATVGETAEASTAPKYFEDDNGNKYKWDNDEQDWVMMEEEDEEEFQKFVFQQQGVDHYGKNRHRNKVSHKSSTGSNISGSKRNRENDVENDDDDDDKESVASQQSNISETNGKTVVEDPEKPKKKRKNRKKKKLPLTWIYVEGLPGDITLDELKNHFSKVGLIALNPADQQPRIKIYTDAETDLCKGDCSICYNSEDSVQLALDVFDGGYIRPNFRISVTRAEFDHAKSATNAAASKKVDVPTGNLSGKNHAQVKVARNAMRAALSWGEDDDSGMAPSSALKIIVLEGMFAPADFGKDNFERELEDDVASECSKFGTIEKLTIFSKHPRGVIIVKFSTGFAAQECIRTMNGRFFAGRQIRAFYWDGVTNYSLQTVNLDQEEKEEEARLEEFGDWLEHEQEELPEEFRLRTE